MASAEVEIHSARQLEPQKSPFRQSNELATFIVPLDEMPSARPALVQFAALKDPSLRMVRPIPLDVSVEESHVLVSWSEVDEFGTGETLSAAIDDFGGALRELYRQLFSPEVKLGTDLTRIKKILEQHIQPRK